MKRKNSNKMKYVASLILMLSFVSSVSAFAADTTSTSSERGMGRLRQNAQGDDNAGGNRGAGMGAAGGNICTRISDLASKAEQKTGQIKTPGERFANWQEKATENDAKLAALRAQWSANRDAQFAKLNERATTDAQKAAVAEFEATTEAAISTRLAAVDAAIAIFRAGVKNLITTREQGVGDDRTAFEAAIKAAFDQAQTDCKNNVAPATVRTTLKTALAAARSKFKLDKQDVPKVGGDIQALITARKTAVDAAMATFKSTMEAARVTLKKAFPTDTAAATTSTTVKAIDTTNEPSQ